MIIDLVLIGIVALCIFLGYKKGLMEVGFRIISFVIAIIIALILHGPISNFVINNTSIYPNVKNMVIKNIDPARYEGTSTAVQSKDNDTSKVWVNYINKAIQETANNTKNAVEDVAADKIATAIINIGILIIIFILVRIILTVLNLVVNIISKLPVINQFDKVGGIAYGLIEGLFIVYVALAICFIASSFIQDTGIIKAIDNSNLALQLYNNNLLLKMIG